MDSKKGIYREHSLEEKISLMHRFECGESILDLSNQTGIYPTQIKDWLRRYRAHGVAGLSYKNGSHPTHLKQEIVLKIQSGVLSLHQASIDYRIARGSNRQMDQKSQYLGFRVVAYRWARQIKEKGHEEKH